MSIATIFIIAAIVCFVLALFKVALGEIDLVILGLAFFACGHLPFGSITRG